MSAVLKFIPKPVDPREVALLARIAALIGARAAIASPAELAHYAMKGLTTEAVRRLSALGLPQKDLAFIIPARTLSHREERAERLTPEESDRALRLARILAIGEIVFGERARALSWLTGPKQQFNGSSALEMLRTEIGARMVEEALWQIDEGYAA